MPAVRDAARMLWTRLVGLSVCREQFVACYFVVLLAATVNRVQNVTVSRCHLLMYDTQSINQSMILTDAGTLCLYVRIIYILLSVQCTA